MQTDKQEHTFKMSHSMHSHQTHITEREAHINATEH